MSWDKKTINLSNFDEVLKILKESGRKYAISLLGKVRGQGINDIILNDEWRTYVIKKLEYDDIVIFERIYQYNDITLNDYIVSFTFSYKNQPIEWEYHVIK